MKNKAFTVIACLILVVAIAIPGTLALSTDAAGSQTNAAAEVPATPENPAAPENPVTPEKPAETETPSEKPAEVPTVEMPTEEVPTPGEQPAEEPSKQPEQPAEGTPAPSETKCTCGAAEGEAHKEGCPLYAAPAEPEKPAENKHIESCFDECTDKECKCGCHLFARIMACKTLDEIWAVIEVASDEALSALTDEQNAAIDAKIKALEPAPAPAIVVEQSVEQTVPSEIYYPTVNYTDVAPFGEPVSGSHS